MANAAEFSHQRSNMDETHLPKMRELIAAFPEMEEKDKFGGVWFYGGKKVMATFYGGAKTTISFAATKDDQDTLCQAGICRPTPYMHQHGWVSIDAEVPDWTLVQELLEGAFYKVALKRMIVAYEN